MSRADMPACPSCRSVRTHRIGRLPNVALFARQDVGSALPESHLYRCSDCGLLFRNPTLSVESYSAMYGLVGPECWVDEPGRMDWNEIENYLAKTVTGQARILDFGCHTGGLLTRLGRRHSVTGVEVNPRAAAIARDRTGAQVVSQLKELVPESRFDVVVATDVIEHFNDPGPTISALLRMLVPGGRLILTTGDADAALWALAGARWWYCFYPEHLSFISAQWIRRWLPRASTSAHLEATWNFRHQRLSPLRYAIQCCLFIAYIAAPGPYIRLAAWARGRLGRGKVAYAPGSGLSKDHVFIVLRTAE